MDQAEALRSWVRRLHQGEPGAPIPATLPPAEAYRPRRTARVMAVTSGKGGVGKTNVTVNLACALMALGRRVLIIDADLGLANVDVLLGTAPAYNLSHLLSGAATLDQVVCTAPGGVQIVAGGSGLEGLADLAPSRVQRLLDRLRGLEERADDILIDTGAGVHRAVLTCLLAADRVLLVTTPEPTALTDAYALAKLLLDRHASARIGVVVNQASSAADGVAAAARLAHTAQRFLGAELEHLGSVPWDATVSRCVRAQQPFYREAPQSAAARAVGQLARRLAGAPEPPARLNFFERLGRRLARSPY